MAVAKLYFVKGPIHSSSSNNYFHLCGKNLTTKDSRKGTEKHKECLLLFLIQYMVCCHYKE